MADKANLRSFVGKKTKEAVLASDDNDEMTPDVRQDGDFANTPFKGGEAFEREEPPKDHMRRYWRQFETTPLVREPITSFAQQVVEPGYRVVVESDEPESERVKPNPETGMVDIAPGEADDDDVLDPEERRELERWLENCAIIEKEPGKDIRHMLKKAVIQREVRGTALIEKVYAEEDSETLYGLAFLNAETVRPNTRPGAPLLLLPDDDPANFDVDGELPRTEDGEAAAYTQYTTSSGFGTRDPNSEEVNNFSMNDIIKLTRDADVNEAFGTSRLEACSDTIEGLKQKMRDQNEAIASKAYPLWLFMFGTEEQPWDADDIQRFMQAHDMDEFHPGLKQGVRGDVDIETISGEVADVVDYLQFDIDYIMSAMPLPKYSLGAFEQKMNMSGTKTQERQIQRQLKEARREIEAEFTEVVQQKAQEMFGLDDETAKQIKFKMGIPGEEYHRQQPNDTNINYNGVKNGQPGSHTIDDPEAGDVPGSTEPDGEITDEDQEQVTSENSVWDVDVDGNTAELSDPRLVSTSDVQDDLANIVRQVMTDFRESVLQQIEREYEDAPYAASMAFEGVANTQLNNTFRDQEFDRASEVIMQEVVKRTVNTLGQRNQEVTLDTSFGPSHERQARQYARNVRDSTRNALEELVRRMDRTLERGADNGEELGRIVQRLRNQYSDGEIRQRSQIIAQMELQNAIESTKLTEFERSDEVSAVRVVNPCNENTTALCRSLGGCGSLDGAVARFDADKTLSEQWEEQAPPHSKFKAFNPMPPTPPFHFGCRSELVPVTAEELDEAMKSKPVHNVEQLEEKYGITVEADD